MRQLLPLLTSILCAIDRKLPAEVVASHAFFDYHIKRFGMMRIKGQREAEIRGQRASHIDPVITRVQAFIYATVILLIKYVRLCGMLEQAVDALPKFRIALWLKIGTRILIDELPAFPAIIGAQAAYCGDTHPHAITITRISHDRMQAEPSRARTPLFAGRMLKQPCIRLPRLAVIFTGP